MGLKNGSPTLPYNPELPTELIEKVAGLLTCADKPWRRPFFNAPPLVLFVDACTSRRVVGLLHRRFHHGPAAALNTSSRASAVMSIVIVGCLVLGACMGGAVVHLTAHDDDDTWWLLMPAAVLQLVLLCAATSTPIPTAQATTLREPLVPAPRIENEY